ncbi:MAG: AbrB/MazE/SpoVT family DNA-binding domain-containing protein [Gammaproteobacteria bacterium]
MAHARPLAQERHTLQLGNRGRIVLPAEVRHRLDLKQGDRLILSVEADGTLLLQGTRVLAQRLQGMFADVAPGVDLAGELVADRRAEARQDADADRKRSSGDASSTHRE